MSRKELMKMIALATGISLAGANSSGAADLHPELENEDPPFQRASGPQDPEGGFEGAVGQENEGPDPFGGY